MTATRTAGTAVDQPRVALEVAAGLLRACGVDAGAADPPLEPVVDWAGPIDLPLTDELAVQAACGIMQVHGRSAGAPQPLAVDYATAVAGVLAAQGVLAALIARSRGGRITSVRTSVGAAGLLAVSQYLAAATCGDPEPALARGDGDPPPFVSADGVRFEIETLDPVDWQRFWRAVGADEGALRRGWPTFLHRFATATCPLPAQLHTALRRAPYATVLATGRRCGVGVHAVRTERCAPIPPWTLTPLSAEVPALRPPRRVVPVAAPLAGLVVVEATRRVQGPLAGHVLRMLGAEVIRIEPPGGDPQRGTPPMAGQVSARFSALNAGKRVVELDLATTSGRRSVGDLVAGADVFLHNWAPGKAAAWQLDGADLAAVRPGLVYAHASGWGQRLGPTPPPGTDFVVQAHSGLAAAIRPPGTPAAPSLMTLTDVLGGLVCACGVLAALHRRTRTGMGGRVDSSLLSATGVLPDPVRPVGAGHDRPLPTADGYVVLRRADAAGFIPARSVGDHRSLPTEELVRRLRAHGLDAVAVCTDLRRLAADPRFAAAVDQVGYAAPRPPWEFR